MTERIEAIEEWGEAQDRTRLLFRRWPIDDARATLAIVHGYAEHSGRYGHVAQFLGEAGIEVLALDLRGHGRSGGARGHVRRFKEYLTDVESFLAYAREKASAAPLFVLGHSMGGLVALRYALERRPGWRGLILSSPFVGLAIAVPPVKLFVGLIASAIYPGLTLPNEIPPSDLSHDKSVVDAYANDPLVFKTTTARWFTETMRAIRATFEEAGRLSLDCLTLYAGADRIANAEKTRQLHRKLGSATKPIVEYPGFFHEIFNEIEKEKPLAEMKKWILERA